MASKTARPKNRRLQQVRPLDAEVFALAEKVGLIFDRPEAAPLRAKLFEDATAYRDRIRHHGPMDQWATSTKWTAFLLRMILTCPRILSRPPEFEWVMDDLEYILTRRRWEPRFERDFWDAVTRVKKVMWTGHPHDKALDYFRFETVQSLMNPPVQLKGFVVTSSKSEAVKRTADMEGNLLGKRPHERVVYRSHEKVEKELKEITTLLRPPSSLRPQPKTTLDSEPKDIPAKSKNLMTPSQRRKRVKHK
jgi:hypothetical protein